MSTHPQTQPPDALRWARKFLPDYFTDQPAGFHAELLRDLDDPEKRLVARVAPRGHAKSTCASLAYPLYAICEQKRRNLVIVSHESSLATQFVRDIRTELETNERILARYGNLCGDAREDDHGDPEAEPPADQSENPESKIASRHRASIGSRPSVSGAIRRTRTTRDSSRRVAGKPGTTPRPSKRKKLPAVDSENPVEKKPAKPRTKVLKKKSAEPPPSAHLIATNGSAPEPAPALPPVAVERPPPSRIAHRARRKWSEAKFTTTTNVTVQAKGSGAAFRGMRVGPQRPDLIICDDIEKDDQVATAEGRRKLEQWMRRVVLPALAPDGRLFVVGSMLHHDSLMANLVDKHRFPRWDTRIYRAIEIRAVREDAPIAERPPDAPAPSPRPCGERDGVRGNSTSPESAPTADCPFERIPLWPARWPLEKLDEERQRIGTLAFEAEYQARPTDDSSSVFKPQWLQRYDPAELVALDAQKRLINLMCVDPAAGESRGDFFAVWVGGVDHATGIIYTRELRLERLGFVEQVRRVIELVERWQPRKIGIETNAYQSSLKDMLAHVGRERGLYLPLVGVNTIANKVARIEASSVFYENGTFRLPPVLDPEAEAQFAQFPSGKHDDAPDVCAMAIELARATRSACRIEGRVSRNGSFARNDW